MKKRIAILMAAVLALTALGGCAASGGAASGAQSGAAETAAAAEGEEEIRAVRGAFPFTALDTLNSRSRTEDYLLDLKLRKRQAEEEKEELERKIGKLTEVM